MSIFVWLFDDPSARVGMLTGVLATLMGIAAFEFHRSYERHADFMRNAINRGWRPKGWEWMIVLPGRVLKRGSSVPDIDTVHEKHRGDLHALLLVLSKADSQRDGAE